MSTYTVEQLCEEGTQYAMAMLLRCIESGEPFITYGAVKSELEYQLEIETIFPTQIGSVAGTLMDQILELYPKAPLINVLITRPNGIPGVGVGGYLASRYNSSRLSDWDNVKLAKKKEIVNSERRKIFNYDKWHEINETLFGSFAKDNIQKPAGCEDDFESSNGFGGEAESEEHLKLKEWVASHPDKVGIRKSFGKGQVESRLLSGDEIDVLFGDGNSFKVIEVKSCRSNDEDFKRGIYQCVKYRAVKIAEHLPYEVDVQPILVTERELPPELKERARILGVKCKTVAVNKKRLTSKSR